MTDKSNEVVFGAAGSSPDLMRTPAGNTSQLPCSSVVATASKERRQARTKDTD